MHVPSYSNCLKKQSHRCCISEIYKSLTGRQSLPKDQQFWSLAAQISDDSGNLIDGCELDHFIQLSLISPHQYVGVEIDPKIAALNSKLSMEGPVLLCGEFLTCIRNAIGKKAFNPGIINLDTIHGPEKAAEMAASVMLYCSDYAANNEVVLFVNVMKNNPYDNSTTDAQDFLEAIKIQPDFQEAWLTGPWSLHPIDEGAFRYDGTGRKSRTTMLTHAFRKTRNS